MNYLEGNQEWVESLAEILGGSDALARAEKFANRLPSGYLERTPLLDVAFDVAQVSALEADTFGMTPRDLAQSNLGTAVDSGPDPLVKVHRFAVAPQTVDALGRFRLSRYGFLGIELSEIVPILESFGFAVVEALPTLLVPCAPGEIPIYLDDIGLRWADKGQLTKSFDPQIDGQRLVEALDSVDGGNSEVDLLNRLVLAAGLGWQQVKVLRAYRFYRRQISTRYTTEELDDAFYTFPSVAVSLVSHFEAKFDPSISSRADAMAEGRTQVITGLNSVSDFNHDQILRGYLELIDATVRTNYYLRDSDGNSSPTIVLKFAASKLSGDILSHPLLESFVYSPEMEGVHLRAGLVSRGGIRWSDRSDDFRTEILGLAQAQIKKNAIIVPRGAKGGFVVRNNANPDPDVVEHSYKTFIRSLLSITDNLVDGQVITPGGMVTFDGEDYYLVVAADKGTASFSDVANAVSIERNFWLGDAFASGGSHGYDHKAMRITAHGAWIAARRHFEQLDMDIQNDVIRVAGVGDMSGDVFGNGMLQSRSIALVAAFDHRHIFLDPDPDPAVSFKERERLAGLRRSSWADYDPKVLSLGGGVWSRDSKEIPLHPRVRTLLGMTAESLKPPELISAILQAPVDMIWFGGIGTYLKDRDESDAEIGDQANDLVRITADKVRARVIVEGANLAVTQRARVRYSRRGGRINTDFIDNAAGVAISDREVNLKILLDLAVKEHLLDVPERNGALSDAADEVTRGVLKQVNRSIAAITSAVSTSVRELDGFEALVDSLEGSKRLDRRVESLPSAEEFAKRRESGAGLIPPELSVLLVYAKIDLKSVIENAPLVDDPTLADLVLGYFPNLITQRFSELIASHPLYRQLVATDLAGEIIDCMGIIWAHETSAEFNCTLVEVAGAFWSSYKVLGGSELWLCKDDSDQTLPVDVEFKANKAIATVVNELARNYLNSRESTVPVRLIARDQALVATVADSSFLSGSDILRDKDLRDFLSDSSLPQDIVNRFMMVSKVPRLVQAGEVSRKCGRSLEEVLIAFEQIDSAAEVDSLAHLLENLTSTRRWTSWQVKGIRDDLVRWRIEVCVAALVTDPTVNAKEAIQNWQNVQRQNLEAVHSLFAMAPKYPDDEPVLVSLALRKLQSAI